MESKAKEKIYHKTTQNNNIQTQIQATSTNSTVKKDKWYSLIIEWIYLLRKEKIYLSLIPHIFDQATDFGNFRILFFME